MEHIMPIFIMLIIFSSIFGISYVYITARNKERLMMIEKDFDPESFKRRPNNGPSPFTYWSLKIGMLSVGVAAGVLVGMNFPNYEDGAMAASVFFFAGLFLILNFFLERLIWKKDYAELKNK